MSTLLGSFVVANDGTKFKTKIILFLIHQLQRLDRLRLDDLSKLPKLARLRLRHLFTVF